MHPEIRPFNSDLPLTMAMSASPPIPSATHSGGPKANTSFAIPGIIASSTKIPIKWPKKLAVAEAPSASPARPCWLIA